MNNKKKILFSLTYYQPNISGVTIYAERLAKELAKRGYEITILSSWYQENWPRQEKKGRIKIIREKVNFRLGKGVFMFGLPFTAWREVGANDVVICHLPQFESFLLAIIAKIRRKKLILVYHADLIGLSGLVNFVSQLATNVFQLIAGILADKIVAYTKDYANHSFFLKLFKNKVAVIYPPVIVAKPVDKNEDSFKKKLEGNYFKIGYAGRIAAKKGIDYLLKSIPYLKKEKKPFKIIFAGPNEVIGEDYQEEIKDLISKYRDFLIFLGPLNQSQLSFFYQKIDVLVLASEVESFGLVQVEAMFNGCPVVASNLPGVRVPVKLTGMGKLVPPGNSRRLAAAIAAVIFHRQKYLFPQKARRIFSLEKTISLYEKLLS